MHDFLERFLEVVDLFVGCGADNAGRVAGSDRIVGNVMRDHAAGADDAAAAYLDARTDDHAAAQPAVVADFDARSLFFARSPFRSVHRMHGRQKLYAGTYQAALSQANRPEVEKNAVEIDVGPFADGDIVSVIAVERGADHGFDPRTEFPERCQIGRVLVFERDVEPMGEVAGPGTIAYEFLVIWGKPLSGLHFLLFGHGNRLLVEALHLDQLGVDAVFGHQLRVCALFRDPTPFDDDDFVGVVDGREAVGDHDRCAALQQGVKGVLHKFFALGVEGRSRFVEDQDFGILEYGSGDAQALALTAREFGAPVADVGVVARRTLHDEVVGVGDFGRSDDLFVRRSPASHGDVVFDGVVEQHGILRNDAHVGTQALLRVVADRNPVDQDVAARSVVEAGDQLAEGRFAAARRTDQSHCFSSPDVERDAVDHLPAAVVGEVYIAEFDLLVQAVQRLGVGLVLDFRFGIEHVEDALACGDTLIDVGELVDERAHGAGDLREYGDEADESAGRKRSVHDERTAEDDQYRDGRQAEEFAHRRG